MQLRPYQAEAVEAIYHHLRTLTAAGWLQSTGRGRYEVPVVRIVPLLVLILAARR